MPPLDEPPLEPDEPAPELEGAPPSHRPLTTLSQPAPHVADEAHPIAGLWQERPAPPSGYLHDAIDQPEGQHASPLPLDEAPAPELDDESEPDDEPPELDDESEPDDEPPELDEAPAPELDDESEPDDEPPELAAPLEPDADAESTELSGAPRSRKSVPPQPLAIESEPTDKAHTDKGASVRIIRTPLEY